jgi:hypothetical protein
MVQSTSHRRIAIRITLVLVVVLAAALRFWRLDEMEYKSDERWMYQLAVEIPSREPWPALGMVSGVGLPNPALSVLLFVGLAKAGATPSPEILDARVVALNVAALALVFLFAHWCVDEHEREAWRWGGALAAVSPFAVLLERKIWAQSALPLFSMLFLIGWARRDRRWGALLWGLVGACLGQIHLSGFFFSAAYALWELIAGRYRAARPATRWRWFLAGSTAGGIGIAMWIAELVNRAPASLNDHGASGSLLAGRVLVADFPVFDLPLFWVNWFCDAGGLGLDYSLGPHYRAFLVGPMLIGHATGLVLVATLVSGGIAGFVAVPWAFRFVRDVGSRRLRSRAIGSDETAFTEGAAIGLFGLFLTLTGHAVQRHYLIVAYPLQWVWMSRLALRRPRGRSLLIGLWIAQLVISLSFLSYIHTHHGADGGDYGRAYRWQEQTIGHD